MKHRETIMSKAKKNKDNIILIGDGDLYEYELPKMPSDEKLIDGYNLKRQDQIWRRPAIKDVRRMTERERIEYISGVRDKWRNGHWMFIDGEAVWITGMHWDFLVINKFDFGYADYLEQQRFDFYFRDLVRKDTNCYGKAILKCRRCGMTAEEIEEAIYTLLEDENCNIGLQSNEYKKCLTTLMHPLVDTYLSRPKWMREEFYSPNGKKPRNSLELISNKVDVLNEPNPDDVPLGGKALPYPTTPAAQDGTKKRLIIQDESFKWTTADPEETLDINKKCVVEYGIKGKVDVLSTMGDSDDYLNAVKKGCKIILDSNPKVRDGNGRTTSGLYEWFVGAIHSADIPQEHRDPAYTRFGKINRDKAEAYIWSEVNKYDKNSKQYVFALRRLPIEKKHGLMAATDKVYFPIIRMEDRINELKAMPRDKKPYVRGNLEEDKRGNIYFVEDIEGVWLVAVHPYFSADKGIDTRNRYRFEGEVYFPAINPEGCIGYDPIRYKTDNTTSDSLSQACAIVYKKFDYFNSEVDNAYCAFMLYRPDNPRDAHREVIKACKYWGYPCMAERQVETTEEEFDSANMLPFLLKNPKDKKWGIWTDSQGKVVENGLQNLITHFAVPVNEGDKDMVANYPFEEGLIDYKNFDMQVTTKSHATMATIMLHEGLKQIVYTNATDTTLNNMIKKMMELNPVRN